jgi:hypothetical protein
MRDLHRRNDLACAHRARRSASIGRLDLERPQRSCVHLRSPYRLAAACSVASFSPPPGDDGGAALRNDFGFGELRYIRNATGQLSIIEAIRWRTWCRLRRASIVSHGFDTLTEQTLYSPEGRASALHSPAAPSFMHPRSQPPSKSLELQPERPDASNDWSGAAAR